MAGRGCHCCQCDNVKRLKNYDELSLFERLCVLLVSSFVFISIIHEFMSLNFISLRKFLIHALTVDIVVGGRFFECGEFAVITLHLATLSHTNVVYN